MATSQDLERTGAALVGFAEVQQDFGLVVARAAEGERVVVTRDGAPVVALVPVEDVERMVELQDLVDITVANEQIEAIKAGTAEPIVWEDDEADGADEVEEEELEPERAIDAVLGYVVEREDEEEDERLVEFGRIAVTDAPAHLTDLVEVVVDEEEWIVVTRDGELAAVVVAPDDIEEIAFLAERLDRSLVQQCLAEIDAGTFRTLDEIAEILGLPELVAEEDEDDEE